MGIKIKKDTMPRLEDLPVLKIRYYMIFWTRSTVIPVEKAGFYRGTPSQFKAFLEKKCQKIIMKAR